MAAERNYKRGVSEVFGYPSNSSSTDALYARSEYECPFLGTRCIKVSQHRNFDSSVPFGACSVWHRGAGIASYQPHIICPVRFIQGNQIFFDASRLLDVTEDDEVIILPEVGLPFGRLDYVLALYDRNSEEVKDFVVLEVMACSTTSTGYVLQSLHDILQDKATNKSLKYGINFRQVLSRMLIQVLAKAYACEKWNKRTIWVIQDVLYQYMQTTTKVDLQEIHLEDVNSSLVEFPILLLVYGLDSESEEGLFNLNLREAHGGTKEDFARILEPNEIPEAQEILNLIQNKIQNQESAFTLSDLLNEGIGEAASQLTLQIEEDASEETL